MPSRKIGDLTRKKCRPCEGKTKPFSKREVRQFISRLTGWNAAKDSKSIGREYTMKNFKAAVDFIHRIAQVAESEDHHPDLHLTSYRKLRIELATHSIGGLSENDFILAAKIDKLPKHLKL